MGAAQQTAGERGFQSSPPGPEADLDALEVSWVRKRVRRKFANEAAFVQLRSELAAALPEFELLIERVEKERAKGTEQTTGTDRKTRSEGTADEEAVSQGWEKHGLSLVEKAREALGRGEIQEAWRHIHTARRFEVYGLSELDRLSDERARLTEEGQRTGQGQRTEQGRRSEIQIRAAVVREEALDALGGWRRRAVTQLLCDDDGTLREGITGSELRAAIRVLHEQYESVYLARSERQRQFNQLVVMGSLSGLALFALTLLDLLWGSSGSGVFGILGEFFETPFGMVKGMTASAGTSATGPSGITRPGFAVYMTVAGVMGASLFGILSLQKQSISTKIPQQISQLTVTSARGVIGAISALLLYFTLQTPVLDGAILADGVLTPWLMVVIGFAAGYTERLAPTVVGKIASLTEADERTTPEPGDGTRLESRERIENRPTTTTR